MDEAYPAGRVIQ